MSDTHTTAHIPDEAVQAKRHLIQSYDWFFKSTGVDAIDDILSSIADAAESYHNTSQWKDEGHIDRIQKYADVAAAHLSAPCAVEVPEGWQLVPKVPTFEMAKAAIDLDPKSDLDAKYKAMLSAAPQVVTKPVDHSELLGNSEQLKPVDVAAVRRQAHEEAAELLDQGFDMPVEKAWRNDGQPSKNDKCPHDKFMYEDCMICASAAIRALSAEPVQRDQWQPIETAPKDGARFLATLSNGWIVILSETGQDRYAWYQTSSKIHIPVARTHPRDSLKESILATHWMPLPAAPTTEAGK